MKQITITAIFCTLLGLAAGYSISTYLHKKHTSEAIHSLHKTTSMGVLLNNSKMFISLTDHLNEKNLLHEDPTLSNMLLISIEGIIAMDNVNRAANKLGHAAPTMFEDLRNDANRSAILLHNLAQKTRKRRTRRWRQPAKAGASPWTFGNNQCQPIA